MAALLPANSGAPAIDARAVSKFFGNTTALHDVTFSMNRGERALVLGGPASGKTTLLKVLAGHVTPSGGRVRISGVDARTSRLALNDRVGFVGQDAGLAGSLGLTQALRFSGCARHLPDRVLEQRISDVIETCELTEVAGSTHAKDGFRVRVALAVAILHSPAVLLIDGHLADVGQREWRTIVRVLDRLAEAGMTVMLSGRPNLRRRLTVDRTFELNHGRLKPAVHAASHPSPVR